MLQSSFPVNFFFFFNDTATTEIYPLSLHDALPILHTSDAEAPTFDDNHAFRSAVLPDPSHSTVELEAPGSIVGGVVSSMVIVAVVWLELLQLTGVVNFAVAVPVAPQSSLRPVKSFDHTTPL